MTNLDAVGAPAPPPPPPCQNPTIALTVEKALLTLKHDCLCQLTIVVEPASCPVTDYVVEIQRASGGSWYPLAQARSTQWTARVAGKFKLRGKATVDGSPKESPPQEVEVQFPTYDQIVADAAVRRATDIEWRATVRDCQEKPNIRRERGFFIRVDSKRNRYSFTNHVTGGWVGPGEGAGVMLGARPPDEPPAPAPNAKGSKYVVASFHTHTPTAFRDEGRDVGPSGADDTNNGIRQIPGVVYDYVATIPGDPFGGNPHGAIPARHPKTASARLYKSPASGLVRRPTP